MGFTGQQTLPRQAPAEREEGPANASRARDKRAIATSSNTTTNRVVAVVVATKERSARTEAAAGWEFSVDEEHRDVFESYLADF